MEVPLALVVPDIVLAVALYVAFKDIDAAGENPKSFALVEV